MRKRLIVCIYLLLSCSFLRVGATHIAGAELTYNCINSANGLQFYDVTLKLYRDCLNANPQALFPDPVTLMVYRSRDSLFMGSFDIPIPALIPRLEIPNWSACSAAPQTLCIEEGIYNMTITLPIDTAGGYDVAYSLCCRNQVISSMPAALQQGVTFLAHIPGTDVAPVCNNMAGFNQQPSLFICAGQTYNFDHSATDIDGDSLVYRLTRPYSGVNLQGQGASPQNGPQALAGPPPYRNVIFNAGFNYVNPFGSGGINIDPQTGYLTASPQNPGIFVVCISVFEYRDGVLLCENRRDFQFNVIACLQQSGAPVVTHNLSNAPSNGDTVLAEAGMPFCVDFTIADTGTVGQLVVQPISVIFGGNGAVPGPYASLNLSGQNPIQADLCWAPACELVGQTFPVVITARDTSDCQNHNIAKDTIWVKVIPGSPGIPIVGHQFGNLPVNGDTILMETKTDFCFEFFIVDTAGNGNLSYSDGVFSATGDTLVKQYTLTTRTSGDTLFVEWCWESFCNFDAVYVFKLTGFDTYRCPPANQASDSVYMRVLRPPSAPPVTTLYPGQNPVNGDTLLATVHDTLCFDVQVTDTSGLADSLFVRVEFEEIPGNGFAGLPPLTRNQIVTDTLWSNICWVPRCLNADKLYRVLVYGVQAHTCWLLRETVDTLYIRVQLGNAPPPLLERNISQGVVSNDTVYLLDAEDLCFDFTFRDTVQPSYLIWDLQLEQVGGNYTGPQPTLSNVQEQGDLISGQACWRVPCAWAGLDFKVSLAVRDSFDCNQKNMVRDSFFVRHRESIPEPVQMCVASVEERNAGVEVFWETVPDPDLAYYLIERREWGSNTFSQRQQINAPNQNSWIDREVPRVSQNRYCYRVVAVDSCGNASPLGQEICTILLQGEVNDLDATLEWTGVKGWPGIPDSYELYQQDSVGGAGPVLLEYGSGNWQTYYQEDVPWPVICYRVQAMAGAACVQQAWSNEICLTFPPKLYLPTGFTPNGDGLNDLFELPHVFVADFHISIYDRWGRLIYESFNPMYPWDGKDRGKAAAEGVYAYYLSGRGYDGTRIERKGTVTLIR